MKKVLKIILDYDDVLVECNSRAVALLNMELGTSYTIEDISDWGNSNGGGIDERVKYFHDPDFVLAQRPHRGAVKLVKTLQTFGEVFICTAVPPLVAGARITNILKNFPMIPPENIIVGNRKDLVHGDILLDDGFHNLVNANVTYPVLFRKPWSREITGFLSVGNYDEFITLVKLIMEDAPVRKSDTYVTSLVGPSGSGKTWIARELCETGKFARVKSHTTRKPRFEGEDDYYFIDQEEFLRKKNDGFFFETSSYLGEYYGTAKEDVKRVSETGKNPLLIQDINGAIAIKKHYKNALTVFINRDMSECVRAILKRNLPVDEATVRIISLGSEFRNEPLCDLSVKNQGDEAVKSICRFLEER